MQWVEADVDVDAIRTANSRFVPRKWLLEEGTAHIGRDAASGKRMSAKVMHMRYFPFPLFYWFSLVHSVFNSDWAAPHADGVEAPSGRGAQKTTTIWLSRNAARRSVQSVSTAASASARCLGSRSS